jgi:hypothetical protein
VVQSVVPVGYHLEFQVFRIHIKIKPPSHHQAFTKSFFQKQLSQLLQQQVRAHHTNNGNKLGIYIATSHPEEYTGQEFVQHPTILTNSQVSDTSAITVNSLSSNITSIEQEI